MSASAGTKRSPVTRVLAHTVTQVRRDPSPPTPLLPSPPPLHSYCAHWAALFPLPYSLPPPDTQPDSAPHRWSRAVRSPARRPQPCLSIGPAAQPGPPSAGRAPTAPTGPSQSLSQVKSVSSLSLVFRWLSHERRRRAVRPCVCSSCVFLACVWVFLRGNCVSVLVKTTEMLAVRGAVFVGFIVACE